MNLRWVHIKNFRSCKNVKIQFDSMHALVGANNAGKSNILRALDFFFNPSVSKVDEETFSILKKEHDNSEPVVEQARYKVIAIENEAPTYLKETKISLGAMSTEFTVAGFPIEGANKVIVAKTAFDDQFGEELWWMKNSQK